MFLSYIDRTGGESACWPWTKYCSLQGYGKVKIGDKHYRAHRLTWEIYHGPIPDHMLICHHCDNPPCCNPSHLFIGTAMDNVSDMFSKGRKHRRPFKSPSPFAVGNHGVFLGESNGNHKLTKQQVIRIRELFSQKNKTYLELGKEFSTHVTNIKCIVLGKTWRSIDQ